MGQSARFESVTSIFGEQTLRKYPSGEDPEYLTLRSSGV